MKYNQHLEDRKKGLIKKVGKCEKCGRSFSSDVRLTVDHIIPIDILLLLGFDKNQTFDEENFSVLCKICNNLKGSKLDFSNPKTKILLTKYMERL